MGPAASAIARRQHGRRFRPEPGERLKLEILPVMPNFGSPSEIAREVLRRLAAQRIHPTPENFRQLYHDVAGIPDDDEVFPTRHLRQVAATLPRTTPEQSRLARQFDAAFSDGNWESFQQQLAAIISSLTGAPLPWSALIRDLLAQLERHQEGLSSASRQDALERLLEANTSDPALLHSRLQALVRSWAQLPSLNAESSTITLVDTVEPASPHDVMSARTSVSTSTSKLSDAPDNWRIILADTLENAIGMLLIDTPELSTEASALSRMLREASGHDGFEQRLKQFSYKVQWVAQDQSHIRQALLNLLQLIIENISELVIDDKWLHGQMNVLRELFSRPLDKHVLEEMRERLRDVILKQGTLKHSLSEAQNRLRDMLAHFIDRLGKLADSTGTYHGKISAFATRVAEASSLEELSGLVDEIVTETRQVEQSARSSREELQALRVTVDQANKEIVRLEQELEQASALVRHDPLTGSLNRKGLEEMLKREVSRAVRHNSKLSIAMLDVDNFKKLNDTFGHTTGDEALKHLAAVIRENIRPQDSSGRYGGEEFLLLLPDTEVHDGVKALQRLQRELTRRFFLHDNQKLLITFSAGVTELRADEAPEAAIDRADQAMYRAKRSGKNRVECG